MDTTFCPECEAPAEVEWRAVLESTDGPVEHARIRCLHRHWFLLPVASLAPGEPDHSHRVAPPRVTRRPASAPGATSRRGS